MRIPGPGDAATWPSYIAPNDPRWAYDDEIDDCCELDDPAGGYDPVDGGDDFDGGHYA